MVLENSNNAFIDEDKFKLYCLNFEHPTGKHKANLFKNILNITLENYSKLIFEIKK